MYHDHWRPGYMSWQQFLLWVELRYDCPPGIHPARWRAMLRQGVMRGVIR